MRLVFAGTPAVAAETLARLLAAPEHEVVAVLTRPDAPQGRSRRPVPSPVAQVALEHGLELLRPARPAEESFLERLRELAPEVCPVVAYGALIPAAALAVPAQGWVNVHYSLLPRWRGAAPVQRAILAGDRVSGVSVFQLVPALDAGPVYARRTLAIGEDETAGDLLGRLTTTGADCLLDVLHSLAEGTALATPQPEDGITLAPKLDVADGRIDWQRSAVEIARQVRACHPAPMAWTELDGERFRVLRARPAPSAGLAPGTVTAGRNQVLVGTGDGNLDLDQVQPQGRRPMAAADWARGRRGEPARFT